MRYRITLDGIEYDGSDEILLGPEKRLAFGIQTAEGIVGWYVERIAERSYRSIELVPQAVVNEALSLLQQAM